MLINLDGKKISEIFTSSIFPRFSFFFFFLGSVVSIEPLVCSWRKRTRNHMFADNVSCILNGLFFDPWLMLVSRRNEEANHLIRMRIKINDCHPLRNLIHVTRKTINNNSHQLPHGLCAIYWDANKSERELCKQFFLLSNLWQAKQFVAI